MHLSRKIYRAIEKDLQSGHYAVGSKLPSELELAATFQTSRTTIRQALGMLEKNGYLVRRQGAGTFVVSNRAQPAYVLHLRSLDDLVQLSKTSWFGVLGVTPEPLDDESAERLSGKRGEEWLKVDAIQWSAPGGRPMAYVIAWFPPRFRDLEDELRNIQGPLLQVLIDKREIEIHEVKQDLRACSLSPEIAAHLGLLPHSVALHVLRKYFSTTGVVMVMESWYPSDRMVYSMTLTRTTAQDEEWQPAYTWGA